MDANILRSLNLTNNGFTLPPLQVIEALTSPVGQMLSQANSGAGPSQGPGPGNQAPANTQQPAPAPMQSSMPDLPPISNSGHMAEASEVGDLDRYLSSMLAPQEKPSFTSTLGNALLSAAGSSNPDIFGALAEGLSRSNMQNMSDRRDREKLQFEAAKLKAEEAYKQRYMDAAEGKNERPQIKEIFDPQTGRKMLAKVDPDGNYTPIGGAAAPDPKDRYINSGGGIYDTETQQFINSPAKQGKTTASLVGSLQRRLVQDYGDDIKKDGSFPINGADFQKLTNKFAENYRKNPDFEEAYQDTVDEMGGLQKVGNWDPSTANEYRLGSSINKDGQGSGAPKVFESLPDAVLYKGRIMKDPETRKRLQSDGTEWRPL